MNRLKFFWILLCASVAFLSGCGNAQKLSVEAGAYRDSVLAHQNAVISDVDTFFVAFSDSSLNVNSRYEKLSHTLETSLSGLNQMPDWKAKNELRQASISVCMTVKELHQSEFREMVRLDSVLNQQYSDSLQKCFDSISTRSFNRLNEVQEDFEIILQSFENQSDEE